MLGKTILIFLVAFFGYMHSYWGSTMCNRPLIMGTLVGLVLGDVKTGIVVGSALELAFLGAVPIGASNPPDMTSGSVIATAFVILSGADTGMAVTIAIPVATLVALFDNLQMMFLDSFLTISKVSEDYIGYVLNKINEISHKYSVDFTISISIDADAIPDEFKKDIIISL